MSPRAQLVSSVLVHGPQSTIQTKLDKAGRSNGRTNCTERNGPASSGVVASACVFISRNCCTQPTRSLLIPAPRYRRRLHDRVFFHRRRHRRRRRVVPSNQVIHCHVMPGACSAHFRPPNATRRDERRDGTSSDGRRRRSRGAGGGLVSSGCRGGDGVEKALDEHRLRRAS